MNRRQFLTGTSALIAEGFLPDGDLAGYTDGQVFTFKSPTWVGGPVTISDGFVARQVFRPGAGRALQAGDIKDGEMVSFTIGPPVRG